MSAFHDEEPKKKRPSPAAPDTVIWHYLKAPYFQELMDQCRLSFHQFKKLQDRDKHEGKTVEGFYESMNVDGVEEMKEHAEKNLELILFFNYANCWAMSGHDSARIWREHAPTGGAIKTTVGKLTEAITRAVGTEARVFQLTMEYANSWEDLKEKDYCHEDVPLNVLFVHRKRKGFSWEAEVRFRVEPQPNFLPRPDGGWDSPKPEEFPEWFPVTFKSLDWIDAVVTAPSVSRP